MHKSESLNISTVVEMAPSKITRPTYTVGQPLRLGQASSAIFNLHTYIAVLFTIALIAFYLSKLKRHLRKPHSTHEVPKEQRGPFFNLPPPPFTTSLQNPLTQDLLYTIATPTSGDLAAKAIPHSGDLEADSTPLTNQTAGCGHQHPWRRHSHIRQNLAEQKVALASSDPSIRDDAIQHFEDHDLKAVWRRRTLEFENSS